jgi:hypothetical protein
VRESDEDGTYVYGLEETEGDEGSQQRADRLIQQAMEQSDAKVERKTDPEY